jgi:serine/threonine protein kinase
LVVPRIAARGLRAGFQFFSIRWQLIGLFDPFSGKLSHKVVAAQSSPPLTSNWISAVPPPPAPEWILQAALEISSPQERDLYLNQVCGGDPALQEELHSLITAHLAADTFMAPLADSLLGDFLIEEAGHSLGRYTLIRQIGEGGFGTVYLAEQNQPVKRQVALKIIKPGMDSREIIARFEVERQVLALMDHPHIAKVHDAGTTDRGRPYFVMEMVQGVPITDYCSDPPLGIKARLELFIEVCAAVQHAHQKGIIHRDLKPSNILVSLQDGKPAVKVIDFGIAKAIGTDLTENPIFTQHGKMLGTPQYMSPEQAERRECALDTRSDLYSLGAVLYELLTRTTPLDREQLRHLGYAEMQQLIRESPLAKPSSRLAAAREPASSAPLSTHPILPRDLQGDLDWIVLKALEKDPARRYESAGALIDDLQRFLQHKPIEARPPSLGYLMVRFSRRHRGPVVAATALLIALLLGAVGTTIGMNRALRAKQLLVVKNAELDRQQLSLIDHKERLAGLLAANQKMLSEIQRMSSHEAQLPQEFEALRAQNQTLLDQVKNEVAHQERYAEEIARLRQEKAQLETLAGSYATVDSVREALFSRADIQLRMNSRGQFYLEEKLVPYSMLLEALAAPPGAEVQAKVPLRQLSVKLPAGAKPTDDVFQSRLRQVASAADQIGIRHKLLPQPTKKSSR